MSKKPALPNHRDQFLKRWPNFERWLVAAGSEILVPTNEYELKRFTTQLGVGIVYQDKGGWIKAEHWQGGARDAWLAFLYGKSYRIVIKKKPVGFGKPERQVRALIERDGFRCFYCREDFTDEKPATREHFVAVTHGGPHHLSNLALAHLECNNAVGHMSVAEKMAYAHRCWIEHAAKPPKEKADEPVDDQCSDQAVERIDNIDQSRSECPELSS